MRLQRGGPIGWWAPDPLGVLPLARAPREPVLRRSRRRFVVTVDTAFDAAVRACADPARPHGWIDEASPRLGRLHRLRWAHSIEVWGGDGGRSGGGPLLA